MLSRLALRNAQLLSTAVRGAQSASSVAVEPTRPKRLINPSPVRHGFIPEEWFQAFYPKTGASGPYVFAISLSTYLVSKEIYVLEHEYYNGLSLLIMCVAGVKLFGPKLAQILDKGIDKYDNELNEIRNSEIKYYEDIISHEKNEQSSLDGQKMIMDIKKENVKMQLEGTYRERLVQVYQEVKKRLDYQIQIQNLERRIAQKHMVQWIVNEVLKSITPEQEKATLHQCIKDLEVLAAKV
ncbi:PREDICTED: ATP synthase subunit b, mitochondrial [Acromyrmex echinatior]|uniref:ATP synthase subunit b n=1 Tax=Acromyrmex echinatior TaxID=103372 RepID=F4X7S8_ACREC|nr:PREDICTED: ATP synthase subunit b, mitochondrial [Acromyrmex echinatior]EGI57501.1 ATP synthase subunit b, mitochondrial [Acromyrmex echinatior]